MPQDLMGKALTARRAVMDLCQAIEQNGRQGGPQRASVDDRIAVRDELISTLVELLSSLLAHLDDKDPVIGDTVARARHTLDNVRDAMPKAGE